MARDKARDDKYFNCFQEHEVQYVCNLYPYDRERVRAYIKKSCSSGSLKYVTHKRLYELIQRDLGLSIPN